MTKELAASCALLIGGGYICARILRIRRPVRTRREWALIVGEDQLRHPFGLTLWLFGFLVLLAAT